MRGRYGILRTPSERRPERDITITTSMIRNGPLNNYAYYNITVSATTLKIIAAGGRLYDKYNRPLYEAYV